jgi:hypothetical protein
VIRLPAKQSGIEQAFSKTTKQQELGLPSMRLQNQAFG